jgi:putative ABC transport system permease protein
VQDLGMRTHGILTANISLPRYRYSTASQQMEFFRQAEAALRRLPGVTAVGVSDTLPPGGTPHEQIFANLAIPGKPRLSGGTGGMVKWRWVTPEYFRALDIQILRGQGFLESQRTSSDHVVILSSLLATRLFGKEDPVGQRIRPGPDRPWCTIVGVAANVKNGGLADDTAPEFYRLRRNIPEDWESPGGAFLVESSLAPEAIAPWIRSQIAAIDPTVPVAIETLSERVGQLADRPRFETALLGFFAFTGLAMAVIGLYGVTSFGVAQRTQEIGVRMALGATRANILRLILVEGMGPVAAGGALGLAIAVAASRMLKSLLFGVGPYDPFSFAAVALLLGVVALAASLVPARTATRVEPVVALRYE